jgi:7,8-dihydropterin-6-yl-methyl-4-(beta-D-ribofuranosyl)aminobenzene 5'-phosphate synthase
MHGLIKRLAARNLPVLLHPDFWTRRRIASPDRFVDLPTPSRAAIEDAGFSLIEDRQPSFLLGGMLLVTGEVPRRPPSRPGCPRVTRHGWMASGGTTRWSTKTRRWWRTSAAGDS